MSISADEACAARLLREKGLSCVLVKGETVIESTEKGIRPVLELVESHKDLSGFAAADRIVGKAAAMLYVCLGVSSVYAEVMSREGQKMLETHGIPHACGVLTEQIINRKGTGPCPMEEAVAGLSDPKKAPAVLREKLSRLP